MAKTPQIVQPVMPDKDLKALLIAVNSTSSLDFKYPIGNKDLTLTLKIAEERGLIRYDTRTGFWLMRD